MTSGFALNRVHIRGPRGHTQSRLLLPQALWALAASLSSGAAIAAPLQPLTLHYEAPPECPPHQSVIERTFALMRYHPAATIAADAKISHESTGYRLDLNVDGGRQSVVSASCDSLVQTLAVILALAVDVQAKESTHPESGGPSAAAELGGGQGAPAPSSMPQAAAAPVATVATPKPQAPPSLPVPGHAVAANPPPMRPAPARAVTPQAIRTKQPLALARASQSGPSRAELQLSTQLFTEYGMLRRLAEGPSVGVWLGLEHWSLAASAQWLIPQWKQMPNSDQPRGGYISFLGGEIDGCLALTQSRHIHACVGGQAGDMMGKGSGVSKTQLGHGLWVAGTSMVAWRPKLWSKAGADIRLGVAFPMKRPAFGFDNYSWRFEPYPWSIRLSSGFSWF